ncbi:hypothetical protein D9619_007624 [Psilocybe cf. subviscida]|uniref:DUF6699 domain-containing protein n=1 Tax=Psilocybe cf. subviscida TaxID=2480587 RepID=A0A8H5AUH2_9AGAR|nr:hypothetical protein D9619_007624 [Psilocybe cf. subviscida]
MYAPDKRVHFAPTKTVYSAPQVASSDASSIASSSPSLSQNRSSPLPPHSFQLPQPQLQAPSPGSSSSAELATPPPPPGFYYAQYGHYVNREYRGGERETRETQRWQQQQQHHQRQDQDQRYEYSPSVSHNQPQYLLDQPPNNTVYPRTPFHPAAELDPYPSINYDAEQYHHSHSPSPAFTPSPAFAFTPLFPSDQADAYLPVSKPVIPRTVHIHYLLAYAPYGDPAFSCDLARPPPHLLDAYSKFHSGQLYRDTSDKNKFDVFYEPATQPPMNSIVVTHSSLKFAIDVCAGADTSRGVRPRALPGHYPRSQYGHGYDDGYGSSSSSDEGDMRLREEGFVTVADVLVCLYRELRLAIHPVEYAELAPNVAQRVNEAYFERCASLAGSGFDAAGDPDEARRRLEWGTDAERERDRERERIAEEQKGIRKVDLLMGHTWFIGLSGTLHGPGVWELNVAA